MALEMDVTLPQYGLISDAYFRIDSSRQLNGEPVTIDVKMYKARSFRDSDKDLYLKEKTFEIEPVFPADNIMQACYNGLKAMSFFENAEDVIE